MAALAIKDRAGDDDDGDDAARHGCDVTVQRKQERRVACGLGWPISGRHVIRLPNTILGATAINAKHGDDT